MVASGKKKKPSKKRSASSNQSAKLFLIKYRFEIFLGIAIGVILAALLFLISTDEKKTASKKPPVKVIQYEENLPPTEEILTIEDAKTPVVTKPTAATSSGPRVAIIIDDMGIETGSAKALLAIDAPITFSVLPFQAYSSKVCAMAINSGREAMLHMPMQPKSVWVNPGEGVIRIDHSDDEIVSRVKRAILSTPGVIGVNNHMGSLFTENEAKVTTALRVFHENNLFYIDSRTTSLTVAHHVAESLGMAVASRKVFLDNERDITKISANIRLLATKARKNGSAIGIGHPYPETIAALRETIPKLREEGILFTYVSELLRN